MLKFLKKKRYLCIQNQILFNMKKHTLLSFLFLFAIILACNGPEANKTEEKQEQTQDKNSESPNNDAAKTVNETPPENNANSSFTVNVLKDDIASPRKEMKGTLGEVEIVINYGSPSVKGRKIWGGLEPYDKVWRTGANEATTFEVNRNIKVQGQELPAGKYALFTIPNPEEWTVIFNQTHEQWGAYEYDEAKDVLRVKTTPKVVTQNAETMEFALDGSNIILSWELLSIPIGIGG